jgi:hypothetical protein
MGGFKSKQQTRNYGKPYVLDCYSGAKQNSNKNSNLSIDDILNMNRINTFPFDRYPIPVSSNILTFTSHFIS